MRAPSLALALALVPAIALAHPVVVGSDPPDGAVLSSPPGVVRVRFSEPVQPFAGGLAVLGPTGHRVETGPVAMEGNALVVPVDAAEQGTYVVRWRVVGDDTHPARGEVVFSVGHAGPAPAQEAAIGGVAPIGLALQAASRWLHFLGYALGFGTLAAGLLVGAETRRLPTLGALLLLAAEPLALFGQTGSLGADMLFDPDTVAGALDSSFGRALALRLGAGALLWALLGMGPLGLRLALVLGWLLALFDGTTAHAIGALMLLVNALHEAAMGVWIGAVVLAVAHRSARGFGRVAVLAFALLVATGLAMALSHLTSPADLLANAYGGALAFKVLAVAAALALARWRRLELGALLGIIGLAGLLVSLPPPR